MNNAKVKKCTAILFITAVIIAGICVYAFVIPKAYIKSKYNGEVSDIKITSFVPGHFAYDISYWSFVWRETKWTCKSDDREFTIIKTGIGRDAKIMDDYQLKDLSLWCLELLKSRISPDIDCVDVSSEAIFLNYEYADISEEQLTPYRNKVWTKEETQTFLSMPLSNCHIYIRDDEFEKYLKNKDVFNDLQTMHEYSPQYGNTNESYAEFRNSIFEKCRQNGFDIIAISVHKYSLLQVYYGYWQGGPSKYGFGELQIDWLKIDYSDYYNNPDKFFSDNSEKLKIYDSICDAYII